MAERLTKRFDSGNVGFFKDGTPTENAMKLPKIMELLAAYEDTGLEPSEVVDTVKLLQDVATKYETSVKINSINTGLLNKAQEELEAYRALGTVEELAELVEAKQEGRLVVLEKPALNENSPKPKCFYNDNGSRWCLGLAQGDDDYPINNCQKCFFSEFNAEEREETKQS